MQVIKLNQELDLISRSNDDIHIFKNGTTGVPIQIEGDSMESLDLWVQTHRSALMDALTKEGAILFRGFPVDGAKGFNELFRELVGESLEYKNQSSPREKVFGNIYTSTEYPNYKPIYMHTENSYSRDYIRVISFYCDVPPGSGGETPIADERKLLTYLDPRDIALFREKGVMYVRNITSDAGLNWETVFQTSDKNEINQKLERDGVDYSWMDEDHLKMKWVLPAIHSHPITGEDTWFNHMFFYHKDLYDQEILEYFDEEDLPFVSYFGDGSPIPSSVIDKMQRFYEENSITFSWQKNDFLLLDNMMFAHSRSSFTGERRILTAMSEPLRYNA